MQRIVFCVSVIGVTWCTLGRASGQEPLPPVEEWQICGILAALEDGYPGVHEKAVWQLASFFMDPVTHKELSRKWKGQSQEFASQVEMKNRLLKLLKNHERLVREMVADVLARVGAKEAVPEFVRRLKDQDPSERAMAASALVRLNATDALPDVRKLLKNSDPLIRWKAADLLAQLGTKDNTQQEFINLLRDQDRAVRATAAYTLVKFGLKEAVPELLNLLGDERIWTREQAINGLVQLKATEAAPALVNYLRHNKSETRKSATDALVALEAREVVPDLLILFKDPEAGIRKSAADTLIRLKPKDALAQLRSLLKGTNAFGRERAAYALGFLGEKEDVPELVNCLQDRDPLVRQRSVYALRRLGAKETVPELRKLLKDQHPLVRQASAYVLARLGDEGAVPELINLLQDEEPYVRADAVDALVQLNIKKAVPKLIEMLSDQDSYVKETVADALGKLKAQDGVPGLKRILKDEHLTYSVRKKAVKALLSLSVNDAIPELIALFKNSASGFTNFPEDTDNLLRLGGTGAVQELIKLLNDPNEWVQRYSSQALVRLKSKEAIPEVAKLLTSQDAQVRGYASETLVELKAREAVPHLMELLKSRDSSVRQGAAYILGRLEARSAIPQLLGLLKDQSPLVRRQAAYTLARWGVKESAPELIRLLDAPNDQEIAAYALTRSEMRLAFSDLVKVAEVAYKDNSRRFTTRWLIHYFGGSEKDAEVVCAYLGRPLSDPDPVRNPKAREVLAALRRAWDYSDSPMLKEDVAKWWSLIITEQVNDWSSEDADKLLRPIRDRLAVSDNKVGRGYLPAIERVLRPFEFQLPIWVRTLLAFTAINLVAILLFVFRPGRRSVENWLPILGLSGASVASWVANVPAELYINPWLLGSLLGGELLALIGAGLISPSVLRQVAQIEPLNRIAVPLALRLPWSRKRLFRNYVASLRHQLERDKDQANQERYLALPADIKTHANRSAAIVAPDPAAAILPFLMDGEDEQVHVLIEAPGGRGKSALLREVVRQALDRFDNAPGSTPLPVLLTGTGESVEAESVEAKTEKAESVKGERVEAMARSLLDNVVLGPDFFARHLQAGDFFLALDGISESGLSGKELLKFVQGPYGSSTPLLLTSRPTPIRAFRNVIEGTAGWLVAEPRPLDESLLGQFVKHYEGTDLPDPVKDACRGPDGTYLPILVRMAMAIAQTEEASVSVADLYRRYFLKLFEATFPSDKHRIAQLEETSRWCLETYWRDGHRRRRYEATALQERLKQAGVLIAADIQDPPKEVQFFHDSMQSYLTAYGLVVQDGQNYVNLPRPVDDLTEKPWNRARMLLWAAANEKFAPAQADLLQTGGTELLQMFLAVFTPQNALRQWLRDELLKWAEAHEEDLRRRDLINAIPDPVRQQVEKIRGVAPLLKKAAQVCFTLDEKRGSVELLGRLYGGIALLIYEIEEGGQ